MKPLASGSIMQLDSQARPEAQPKFGDLLVRERRKSQILLAAVAEPAMSLDRIACSRSRLPSNTNRRVS